MITIDKRQIQLQSRAANKEEAIRQVGQLLVDSENIDAGYIASMLGREEVANTYLGNGISIPHGLPKDRDLIKQTGIAVVQVPAGVTWNPGETAHLIVGIAAKSDEHIEVLRRLTRVLGDEEQVARLTRTTDPRDIIESLTGERPAAPPKSEDVADYANFFDAVVTEQDRTACTSCCHLCRSRQALSGRHQGAPRHFRCQREEPDLPAAIGRRTWRGHSRVGSRS